MPKKQRIWGTLDPFFEGGPILGRTVANVRFLDSLLQADPFSEYHFFLPGDRALTPLRHHLEKTAPAMLEAGRIKLMQRMELPRMLAAVSYHCFHLSDCITSQPYLARMRNRYSERIFPITGLIHSLSYANYPQAFLQHLWPGTTRRDAIVCTSTAGRQAVTTYFRLLRNGFALSEETHPAPALAHIPLAVDTEAYGPGEPTQPPLVRVLVFGRISHHSKMDLVPLIRALHRLVQDGMDPSGVELILAGWSDKDNHTLDTLTHLATNIGISLSVHLRPSEANKLLLFQSADIFVSIADNPQETFGITLVEAGAFGLPVVASDYDGYRDIVEDGVTGLLVPTTGPAATPEVDLMAPLTFDNLYHLQLAQTTAVDIPLLAEALGRLIHSPTLRQTMGTAARNRVLERFSWPKVIDQYVTLWDTLWNEPAKADPLRNIPHPLAPDFGALFSHYTSQSLNGSTVLKIGRTGEAFYRDRDYPNVYAGLHGTIDSDIIKKLAFFARNPVDTTTLIRKVSEIAPLNSTQIENHILWALKQDILQKMD